MSTRYCSDCSDCNDRSDCSDCSALKSKYISLTYSVHNVQFVKYNVTVSFMAQVLDTVTYLVPQVLDTAS